MLPIKRSLSFPCENKGSLDVRARGLFGNGMCSCNRARYPESARMLQAGSLLLQAFIDSLDHRFTGSCQIFAQRDFVCICLKLWRCHFPAALLWSGGSHGHWASESLYIVPKEPNTP